VLIWAIVASDCLLEEHKAFLEQFFMRQYAKRRLTFWTYLPWELMAADIFLMITNFIFSRNFLITQWSSLEKYFD